MNGKLTTRRNARARPGLPLLVGLFLALAVGTTGTAFARKPLRKPGTAPKPVKAPLKKPGDTPLQPRRPKAPAVGQHAFRIGEPVKLMAGPYSGFSGTVVGIDTKAKRLDVSFQVLGKTKQTRLGFFQVQREL